MNLFQAANGAATFLILSAIVAGLAKHFDSVPGSPTDDLLAHPEVLYLAIFMIVFRIKTLLDDHKHFAEPQQDKSAARYVGFLLAVVSWVFWGLAAYLLPSTVRSSELMAVSILVSTLWIAVHLIEILIDKERRNAEALTSVMREKWVIVNVLYILLLIAHVGVFRPVVQPGARAPLVLLLALLFFDVLTSRSFRGVTTPNPTR